MYNYAPIYFSSSIVGGYFVEFETLELAMEYFNKK